MPSRPPLVSVVIPTYRRPHLIGRAVSSILRQTVSDLEVLVVIDGTDDGTRAAVDSLGDPRAYVIETQQNQGPATTRNIGVRHARGDYIGFLDDDDEWMPEKLNTQLQLIRDRELTGEFLVSCRVLANPTYGSPFIVPQHLYQDGQDLSDYLMDVHGSFKRGYIAAAAILLPRSLALRVPFPDDMFEDWSWLFLCVVRDRVPLLTCPEPLYVYHLDPGAVSRNKGADWRQSLDWMRRYHTCISRVAFSALLAGAISRRAKRQDGLSAVLEIAKTMHREGKPRLLHWMMIAGVAVLPIGVAEQLRRLLRHARARPTSITSTVKSEMSVPLCRHWWE
jgi:glycosyltransferase involved in cell wall biosynthesis